MEDLAATRPTALASASCPDCGAPLAGPYCSHCGMEAAEARRLSTRLTFHDLIEEFVQYDGSFFRSLRNLVAHPGLLTTDFLAGRRARHLAPAKLYLLVNLVFFVTVQWFDPITAGLVSDYVGPQRYAAAQAQAGMTPAAFDAMVVERVTDTLPMWLFVLVPAFAVVLALLHVRRRQPFAAHAAFAFHFLTFALVAFLPGTVVGGPLGEALISGAFFVAIPWWLALGLRRLYGQPWLLVLLKTALMWNAFVVVFYYYTLALDVWAVTAAAVPK